MHASVWVSGAALWFLLGAVGDALEPETGVITGGWAVLAAALLALFAIFFVAGVVARSITVAALALTADYALAVVALVDFRESFSTGLLWALPGTATLAAPAAIALAATWVESTSN